MEAPPDEVGGFDWQQVDAPCAVPFPDLRLARSGSTGWTLPRPCETRRLDAAALPCR